MKHLYPLDLEQSITAKQLITVLPGNVYWKDLRGCYLGSNHSVIHILGLRSEKQIIGKNDNELLGQRHAEKIIENDRAVIAKMSELTFDEYDTNKNRKFTIYLSKKVPLYNNTNTLIGIMGISFDITNRFNRKNKETTIDEVHNNIILHHKIPKLTIRQQQCLKYLLMGFSAKDISFKLKISARTVESHIGIVKEKFSCNTKSDLINKVLSISVI